MAGGGPDIGSYSPLTGFIFIFNLIVGAGALTIPHAFAQVGILYGALALSILALTSYVTATFMIEAIAGVNALLKHNRDVEKELSAPDELPSLDSRTEYKPLMVSKVFSIQNMYIFCTN
jgi:hypothetical protein